MYRNIKSDGHGISYTWIANNYFTLILLTLFSINNKVGIKHFPMKMSSNSNKFQIILKKLSSFIIILIKWLNASDFKYDVQIEKFSELNIFKSTGNKSCQCAKQKYTEKKKSVC